MNLVLNSIQRRQDEKYGKCEAACQDCEYAEDDRLAEIETGEDLSWTDDLEPGRQRR